MEENRENNFLDDWKNVINELKELGLITEKQIKTGIEIPIELIADAKIDREFLQMIIIKMHERVQSSKQSRHFCLKNPILEYYEADGEPILQIREPKGITYFANTKLPVVKGNQYQMRYAPKSACIALGIAAFDLKIEQVMSDKRVCEQNAYREVSETFFETRGKAGEYISKMFTQGAIEFGEFCKQQIDGIVVQDDTGYTRRPNALFGKGELCQVIAEREITASTFRAAATGVGVGDDQSPTIEGGMYHGQ